MNPSTVYDCSIIELSRHHSDRRGNLTVVENGQSLPFDVARIFYL
ncbi:MAG: FdtA/QdtA family cupin domain-containing protein, partial [Muribaculaceae bacterium]|nr:FdtA/QdtA family cupin domain-containing protein [Muribaculaceae bacterium]